MPPADYRRYGRAGPPVRVRAGPAPSPPDRLRAPARPGGPLSGERRSPRPDPAPPTPATRPPAEERCTRRTVGGRRSRPGAGAPGSGGFPSPPPARPRGPVLLGVACLLLAIGLLGLVWARAAAPLAGARPDGPAPAIPTRVERAAGAPGAPAPPPPAPPAPPGPRPSPTPSPPPT